MSASPASTPCPRTDAVLALHLDGDLGGPLRPDESGYEFVCPQTLTEHLRDCEPCQRALRRARRLDAALAEAAGRRAATATDGRALDDLLALAQSAWAAPLGETAAVADPGEPGGRLWPLRLACAAVLLLPAVLWPTLLWPPLQRALELSIALTSTPSTSPAPDLVANAADDPGVDAPDVGPDIAPDEALYVASDAPRRLRRSTVAAAEAPPEPVPAPLATLADANAAPALRLLAGQHLLRALETDPTSLRELAPLLTSALAAVPSAPLAAAADSPATDLAAELSAAAATSPRYVAWLRQTLQQVANTTSAPGLAEQADLVVAARLGNRELDAAVVRVVRRWSDLAPVLAAALRTAPDRCPGRAELRLDAWQALAVRGDQDDGIDSARLWFGGAPAATFAELSEQLAGARTAARRLRCLLAMGCCVDGRTLQPLLQQLESARLDDGLAAAYALAHLPHRDLTPLVSGARSDRDAWLLRAALTWAGLLGDPASGRGRTQLTAQGRPAAPTLARFTTFAHQLRERAPTTGG